MQDKSGQAGGEHKMKECGKTGRHRHQLNLPQLAMGYNPGGSPPGREGLPTPPQSSQHGLQYQGTQGFITAAEADQVPDCVAAHHCC
jgi:hypothetical protein